MTAKNSIECNFCEAKEGGLFTFHLDLPGKYILVCSECVRRLILKELDRLETS